MAAVEGLSKPLALITAVVVVASLYFAQTVLVPLSLAVLLSFLLAPLVIRLQRMGLGRVPAVIAVVVVAFLILGAIGAVVAGQVADMVGNLPQYAEGMRTKLEGLQYSISATLGKASETVEQIAGGQATSQKAPADGISRVMVVEPHSPLQIFRNTVPSLLGPLGTAGIVVVLVIFILLQREDLRDRIIRLLGQVNLTTQALDDAATRVSSYLMRQSIINAVHGTAIGVGLLLLGVPNALMWGLLSALLRFIPYLGPFLAAILPIGLSLGYFDDWSRPLMVLGLFLVVELISNNVLEPWLYGTGTGMSPLAVIVSAIFWTALWGGVGLLLATPLTVCLLVIGKYVPQLDFLVILLGNEPALPPSTRFYQRLLAMDVDEAMEILDEQLVDSDLCTVYDSVVIPALSIAEHDRHRGALDDKRHEFIDSALKEILEDLAGRYVPPAAARLAGDTCVLCLPARDEADALVGTMFAQVMQLSGVCVETAPLGSLAAEMVAEVAKRKAHVVVVSALPPSTVAHARYLCKRLVAHEYDSSIVVGLWNARVEPESAERKIGCGSKVRVVRTLIGACELVRNLMPLADQNTEVTPEVEGVGAAAGAV